MLRKIVLSGVLSLSLGAISIPAVAAPLAPTIPQIDNPALTQVARRVVRRTTVRRGPHFRSRTTVVRRGPGRYYRGGYYGDYWGPGIAAGIVGFGLGAALADPYYYGGRCYVDRGGVLYRVDCGYVGY